MREVDNSDNSPPSKCSLGKRLCMENVPNLIFKVVVKADVQ